jgi:hypothetical protein
MTLATLVLGILTFPENKFYTLNLLIFIFFLASVFFGAAVRDASYSVVLPWFAYLALKRYASSQMPPFFRGKPFSKSINALLSSVAKEHIFSSRKSALSYYSVLLFILAFFLLINLENKDFVQRYLRHPADFKDYTNDVFYARISENSGLLLTTDFFLISLRTRRPILLDPSALDAFAMVPESGDIWNNALRKIYGIDLFKPPPTCYRHRGIIFPILYKKLWENRGVEEWQTIKKEFGVTNILTRKSFKLSLPVVMEDDHKILYEIPEE